VLGCPAFVVSQAGWSNVLHPTLWTARCWALNVALWKGTERRSLRQAETVRMEIAWRSSAVMGRRMALMIEGDGLLECGGGG
jgi:hypothetical protein